MKRKWTLPEKLAVAPLGALALALLSDSIQQREPGAGSKTICLSNVKSISVASSLYAEDNSDRLPASSWWPGLSKFVASAELIDCPQVEAAGKKFGYAMNLALAGQKPYSLGDPSKTVMFFETDALGPGVVMNLAGRNRDRHMGKGSNVAYADTHAKFVLKDTEP